MDPAKTSEAGSGLFGTVLRVGLLGLGVGVGLALAAPLITADPEQRRRMLKGVVRGCAKLQDSLQSRFAETQEQLGDLWAEVQAERGAQRTPAAGTRTGERRSREGAPRAHATR